MMEEKFFLDLDKLYSRLIDSAERSVKALYRTTVGLMDFSYADKGRFPTDEEIKSFPAVEWWFSGTNKDMTSGKLKELVNLLHKYGKKVVLGLDHSASNHLEEAKRLAETGCDAIWIDEWYACGYPDATPTHIRDIDTAIKNVNPECGFIVVEVNPFQIEGITGLGTANQYAPDYVACMLYFDLGLNYYYAIRLRADAERLGSSTLGIINMADPVSTNVKKPYVATLTSVIARDYLDGVVFWGHNSKNYRTGKTVFFKKLVNRVQHIPLTVEFISLRDQGRVSRLGSWTRYDAYALDGSKLVSGATGAELWLTFYGSQVGLLYEGRGDTGIAQVLIDHYAWNVDTYYTPNESGRSWLCEIVWSDGWHSMRIKDTGNKNPNSTGYRLHLEGVFVVRRLDTPPPSQIPGGTIKKEWGGSISAGGVRNVTEIYGKGEVEQLDFSTNNKDTQLNVIVDHEYLGVVANNGVATAAITPGTLNVIGGESSLFKLQLYNETAGTFVLFLKRPIQFQNLLKIQIYNPTTGAVNGAVSSKIKLLGGVVEI
jgi:hypothetical protein